MFNAHLQTRIAFPLLACLMLTTYMLKSGWGAHLQGVWGVVSIQTRRQINVLQLWEVHLAHHCLTILVHPLIAL